MTTTQGEFLTTPMPVEEITELLGVTQAAIRKQLSRGRFPEPVTSDGGAARSWRRPDVYRYALQQGGDPARGVPRLFSRTAAPNPARFISNTTFDYPFHHLHLLTWLPSDGAGPVALAHPLNAMPHTKAVSELFSLDETLSAIAVVRGDLSEGPHGWEVSLNIWERGAKDSYIASWSDLLQLLATPLPYWGRGLRQRPAMLAWRPGTSPVPLRPVDDHLDTADISAMLEDVTDVRAARALQAVISDIQSADASEAEQDLKLRPEFPGFQHAATVTAISGSSSSVRDVDLSALLHLTGLPKDKALAALRAWDAWNGVAPYLDTRQQVRPGVTGLPAEWAQRLQLVPPYGRAGGEELGHLFVQARQSIGAAQDSTCYRDPLHPDLWIIRVGATYYYSAAPSVPAAGTLQDVGIVEDDFQVAAFFRDSAGTVWPVPSGHGDINVGYGGSGPYTLAAVLHTLAKDAAADVRTRDSGLPDDDSWLVRQLTSPTGARVFSLQDMTS